VTAAAAAERLAVLLAAGIPPAAAWTWATGESTSDVAEAMAARGWRELAAAWTIALATGAPLSSALRGIAGGLRDAEQASREIAAALAGPIATARLVLALPAVALLLGFALGFDTVRVLFATPLGWACLGVCAVLLLLAFAWNRALVRRARPPLAVPGIGCDLIAVALGGGSPIGMALDVVAFGARLHRIPVDTAAAAELLDLSARAGVPAIELLRLGAAEARAVARSEAQATAARLGVLLMLPLGLCVLPAFFAVGVVPLLATVVGATLGAP
jgi:tight adherence protein B